MKQYIAHYSVNRQKEKWTLTAKNIEEALILAKDFGKTYGLKFLSIRQIINKPNNNESTGN